MKFMYSAFTENTPKNKEQQKKHWRPYVNQFYHFTCFTTCLLLFFNHNYFLFLLIKY